MRRHKQRRADRKTARGKTQRFKVSLLQRLTHHLHSTAQTVVLLVRHPRQAPAVLRGSLVRLWRARGGRLYGLGFVITFVVLEVQTFVQQVATGTSFVSFIADELIAFVLRFTLTSFVNTVLALVWPALLLDRFGGWAIVLLAVGFLGYERFVRPLAERFVPELRPPADAALPVEQAADELAAVELAAAEAGAPAVTRSVTNARPHGIDAKVRM